MRALLTGLFIGMLSISSFAQEAIFPMGEKAKNVHHTGDIWLTHVVDADEIF